MGVPSPSWPLLGTSFQRQVKDISNETGDCLLERDFMRTLPGASVITDQPCHLLIPWALHSFLLRKQNSTSCPWAHSKVCDSLPPCFLQSTRGPFSGESSIITAHKSSCNSIGWKCRWKKPKGENACIIGLIFSSSQEALWLRSPNSDTRAVKQPSVSVCVTFIDHPPWQTRQ